MTLSFCCPDSASLLAEIVEKSLVRSLTRPAVRSCAFADFEYALSARRPVLAVFSAPREEWGNALSRALDISGSKIVLFGALPTALGRMLGVTTAPFKNPNVGDVFACSPAPIHAASESPAYVRYETSLPMGISAPIMRRPCCRYDFTDEWNNRGFGAIGNRGDLWSIAQQVSGVALEARIATLMVKDAPLTVYAALWQIGGSLLLWFNRFVGPVDSQEWRVVEDFIAHAGYPSVSCAPVIGEVPFGYDGAATMRLDCDEDIVSSRALFDFYREQKIPFSLAVHTTNLADNRHDSFLREVVASGGSLLTHSATHAPNWGGSYEAAMIEVKNSCAAISDHTGYKVSYAVSPFHQNPSYAVAALADSELQGFVGGIVRNDPEYLIARGGIVPGAPDGFISHSQSCMLHGDCLLSEDDPMAVYFQAIDEALAGGALFGYLDHPFSPRYAYGWLSEEQRRDAHGRLITHLRLKGHLLFLSCRQALDWIRLKSTLKIERGSKSWRVHSYLAKQAENQCFSFCIRYGGEEFEAIASYKS